MTFLRGSEQIKYCEKPKVSWAAPRCLNPPSPPGEFWQEPPRGESSSRGEGEYKESVQVEQEDHGDPDSNVTELIIQPELQNPTSISKTLKQDKN